MDRRQKQWEGRQPEQVWCAWLHHGFDAMTNTAGIRVRPADEGEIGAYEDTDPVKARGKETR